MKSLRIFIDQILKDPLKFLRIPLKSYFAGDIATAGNIPYAPVGYNETFFTKYSSDLLVINKTDLAPHVGASLDVMNRDATRMRAGRPFVFAALRHGAGVPDIIEHIRALSGLGMVAP